VIAAFIFGALMQAAPAPVTISLAFADDEPLRNRPILVQSYQGTQPCTNVRTIGAERQCDVTALRPNMIRMWAVNADGTYGQPSNFVELADVGAGRPGVIRVTFAGVMELPR
jgi:hypothetical protein